MTMTPLELKVIKEGAAVARMMLQQIKPRLDALNIDYDAAGGVKATVDQTKLDSEISLSLLTKAQLDDGMYALTATLKSAVDTAYTQLEKLAARS